MPTVYFISLFEIIYCADILKGAQLCWSCHQKRSMGVSKRNTPIHPQKHPLVAPINHSDVTWYIYFIFIYFIFIYILFTLILESLNKLNRAL